MSEINYQELRVELGAAKKRIEELAYIRHRCRTGRCRCNDYL